MKCARSSTGISDSSLSSQATLRRFSYQELLQATDKFGKTNLIGAGSFCSIYKSGLHDGMEFAVKVLHQQCARALKSFEAECEILKSIN